MKTFDTITVTLDDCSTIFEKMTRMDYLAKLADKAYGIKSHFVLFRGIGYEADYVQASWAQIFN